MNPIEARAVEPEVWILVFRRTVKSRLINLLAAGRYKHVAAYAYLPGMKAWLFYEVHTRPTSLIVVPDGAHLELMYNFTLDADLVAMRRNGAARVRPWHRLGFYCVPAIRDLVGVDSRALRPSRLYRDCLAAGGTPLGHAPISTAGA